MAIFISYSHQDKDFVSNLAQMLVAARHNIWIDQWELNAGDSIIEKVQDAVGDADALLVVLSKSSVDSEWCKKELRTALVRELDEKKTLVIPCLIEDCEIPMFLREKMYADFREEKGEAFDLLDRSLRRVSNPEQSRIEKNDFHTDWSLDWGDYSGTPVFEWLFADHGPSTPYSIVTRVRLIADDLSSTEFTKMQADGTHLEYAFGCLKKYLEQDKDGEFRIQISDAREVSETEQMICPDGKTATIFCGVRRIGMDNGMDTVFSVDNILRTAIKHS